MTKSTMRKYLFFLIAVMFATVVNAADGDTFKYHGLNFKIISEEKRTVEVVETSIKGEVFIPPVAIFNDIEYDVTVLGYQAFYMCTGMTKVTIPNSVIEIGNHAFYWCTGLVEVNIASSVISIGEYAFFACSNLPSIIIPNSVKSIGYAAFNSCRGLISVTIPNSVESIGRAAFHSCSSLTSVRLPNTLSKIATNTFRNCTALVDVNIPNSVIEIGQYAFAYSQLKSVTIPKSVASIDHSAFLYCTELREINVEEGNETYVSEDGVLYNIDKTELLICPHGKNECKIPYGVKTIGYCAFYDHHNLISVNIPNSVASIGFSSFSGCNSLTSVNIPNSVTSIDKHAFNECRSLTDIAIPNSVTYIGDSAFEYCSSLISLTIPASVSYIGSSPFYSLKNLKKIVLFHPTPRSLGLYDAPSTDLVFYIPKGSLEAYTKYYSRFSDFREMGDLDVSLSTDVLQLNIGDTAEIAISIEKDDDITIEGDGWETLNPNVATVSGGVVTAVAPGSTVIVYSVYDGYGAAHTKSCTVTVTDPTDLVESITLDLTEVEAVVGREIQLSATVTPDTAKNKEIEWSSSDESIATVSATGLVTVHKEGNCVITAATTDGSGLYAECAVSVVSSVCKIFSGSSSGVEVYTLSGLLVKNGATSADINALPAGLYILRQGSTAKKIAVK